MVSLGAIRGELLLEDKFTAVLTRAEQRLATAGTTLNKLSGAASNAGSALLPLSAAVGAAGVAFAKMSIDLNASMANVATLIPGNIARVKELKVAVEDMSVATGKSANDLAAGLYQVISAFGDTADTTAILDISARGAAAGLSTTLDAINLVAAVTKGYGDTTTAAAQKVSDLAFLTVKLGQTTFPELAASMGRVVPVAATLGVAQEELFAGFATLTGVTGGTAEVSTQLAAVLRAMLKPTDDMSAAITKLGFSGAEAMVKQLGMVGSLNALRSTTDGSAESVGKLFGRAEALNAVFALTGDSAQKFNESLAATAHATGMTTEAFNEQTQGINKAGFELQQFWRGMERAMSGIGDVIVASLSRIAAPLMGFPDLVNRAAIGFQALPTAVQSTAVALGLLVTVSAPALLALGSFLRLSTVAADGFRILVVATRALDASLLRTAVGVWAINAAEQANLLTTNLLAAAKTRLAGAVLALHLNFQVLLARYAVLAGAWASLTTAGGSLGTVLATVGRAATAVAGIFSGAPFVLIAGILLGIGAAAATLGGHWGGLHTIMRETPAVFSDLIAIARGLVGTFGTTLVAAIAKVGDVVRTVTQYIRDWYKAWNDIPAPIRALFGPLGTLDEHIMKARAAWPKFRDAVKDWADQTPARVEAAALKMAASMEHSRISVNAADTAFFNFRSKMEQWAKEAGRGLPSFETLPPTVPGALPPLDTSGIGDGVKTLGQALDAARKSIADLSVTAKSDLTAAIQSGAFSMDQLKSRTGLTDVAIKLFTDSVQAASKVVKDTPLTKFKDDMVDLGAQIDAHAAASMDRLVKVFGDDAIKIAASANDMSVKVIKSVQRIADAAKKAAIADILKEQLGLIRDLATKIFDDTAAASHKAAVRSTEAWITNLDVQLKAIQDTETLRRQMEGTTLQDALNDIANEAAARRAQLQTRGADTQAALAAITAWERAAATAATRAWQQHVDETGAAVSTLWKELGSIIQGIPQLLQQAFTGGGGVGGFAKALTSQIGAAFGRDVFTSLAQKAGSWFSNVFGQQLGGAIGAALPGIGAAIGALVGPLLGKLFGPSEETLKVNKPRDVFIAQFGPGGTGLGTGFQTLAATLTNMGQGHLFAMLTGAKTEAQFQAAMQQINTALGTTAGMLSRLTVSVDQFATGVRSSEQTVKDLNTTFPALAAEALKGTGLADSGFVALIQRVRELGLEAESVSKFVLEQLTGAAKGLNAVAAGMFQPMAGAFAGQQDATKALDALAQDRAGLMAELLDLDAKSAALRFGPEAFEDMGISDRAELEKLDQQWDALRKQIAALDTEVAKAQKTSDAYAQTLKRLTTDGQAGFDRMGRLAVAQFDALVAGGMSVAEAINLIGPALDDMVAASDTFGLHAGAAVQSLLDIRRFTQESPAVAGAIGGLDQMVKGLHNSGFLTQEVFTDLGTEAVRVFNEIQAQGLSGNQSLRLMQPTLQSLWQLQRDFGYVVDDATQALLDEAVASGVVGAQFQSDEKKQADALTRIADLMQKLVDLFGIAAGDAEAMATRAVSAMDQLRQDGLIRVTDGTARVSGALNSTPFESWSARGVAAAQAVEDAMTRAALGASPGGVRQISTQLRVTQRDLLLFGRYAVQVMRDVELAATSAALGHSPTGVQEISTQLEHAEDALTSLGEVAADVFGGMEGMAADLGRILGRNIALTTEMIEKFRGEGWTPRQAADWLQDQGSGFMGLDGLGITRPIGTGDGPRPLGDDGRPRPVGEDGAFQSVGGTDGRDVRIEVHLEQTVQVRGETAGDYAEMVAINRQALFAAADEIGRGGELKRRWRESLEVD